MSETDRARAVSPRTWLIVALLPVALTAWVGYVGAKRPEWAFASDAPWYLPAAGNAPFAGLVGAAWILAFLAYWWPRRKRVWTPGPGGTGYAALIGIVVAQVLVGAALGAASYAPCADEVPALSTATRTLLLFVGSFDADVVGPQATGVCAGPAPLSIEIARFAAIGATFVGAVTVLVRVSQERIARWSATLARDVDIVVGLTSLSMTLVRALVDEASSHDDRDRRWGRSMPWVRRTRVVVLHDETANPLEAEAIEAGATVLRVNATRADELRPLLTNRRIPAPGRRRPSVRRLFAVTDRQDVNLRVLAAAEAALAGAELAQSARVVPRLTARLDDAREARDHRLRRAGSTEWFVDALSTDDLVAGEILGALGRSGCETLAVCGDTSLVTALLEAFAWQRWSTERLDAAYREREGALSELDRAERDRLPAPPRRVVLLGPAAPRILREWDRLRPPTADGLERRSVTAIDGDWELAADRLLRRPRVALVLAEPGRSAATRIARLHPDALVLAFDATARGLVELGGDGLTPGFVNRFGPTLHRVTRGADGALHRSVPEDGWTRLARHLHALYIARKGSTGRPERRRWGEPADPPEARLPEFVRADNLRQLRHLLAELPTLPGGRRWKRGRPEDAVALSAADIESLARSEHERWVDLRVRHGWRGIDPVDPAGAPASDERRNGNIRDWDTGVPLGRRGVPVRREATPADCAARDGLHEWNIGAMQDVIDVLRAAGIVPVRSAVAAPPRDPDESVRTGAPGARYRRIGTVTAVRLDAALEWRAAGGDLLRGEAGDWRVVSPQGGERTVAASEFPLLYEPLCGATYRRVGSVSARRAAACEQLVTREGRASAAPGDWIVTGDRGDTWAVPDDVFRASYEPAPGDVR